jgi:ribosome maturation factor RimP
MSIRAEDIIRTVETLAQPVLEDEGLELVEVQYRRESAGWVLRLFIDRVSGASGGTSDKDAAESGVTIDDCVAVSREIGNLLEVNEVIPRAYNLEVSSPGLDRPLRKPSDFKRFTDHRVIIRLKSPLEGRRKFKGRLLGLDEGLIRLLVDEEVMELELDQTERVALDPEVS